MTPRSGVQRDDVSGLARGTVDASGGRGAFAPGSPSRKAWSPSRRARRAPWPRSARAASSAGGAAPSPSASARPRPSLRGLANRRAARSPRRPRACRRRRVHGAGRQGRVARADGQPAAGASELAAQNDLFAAADTRGPDATTKPEDLAVVHDIREALPRQSALRARARTAHEAARRRRSRGQPPTRRPSTCRAFPPGLARASMAAPRSRRAPPSRSCRASSASARPCSRRRRSRATASCTSTRSRVGTPGRPTDRPGRPTARTRRLPRTRARPSALQARRPALRRRRTRTCVGCLGELDCAVRPFRHCDLLAAPLRRLRVAAGSAAHRPHLRRSPLRSGSAPTATAQPLPACRELLRGQRICAACEGDEPCPTGSRCLLAAAVCVSVPGDWDCASARCDTATYRCVACARRALSARQGDP